MYSFYYCLINDYCLIIDRRTQVLFFIFLLTLTSDRRGLSIFALKMTLAPLPPTAQKMETENNEQCHHLAEINIMGFLYKRDPFSTKDGNLRKV